MSEIVRSLDQKWLGEVSRLHDTNGLVIIDCQTKVKEKDVSLLTSFNEDGTFIGANLTIFHPNGIDTVYRVGAKGNLCVIELQDEANKDYLGYIGYDQSGRPVLISPLPYSLKADEKGVIAAYASHLYRRVQSNNKIVYYPFPQTSSILKAKDDDCYSELDEEELPSWQEIRRRGDFWYISLRMDNDLIVTQWNQPCLLDEGWVTIGKDGKKFYLEWKQPKYREVLELPLHINYSRLQLFISSHSDWPQVIGLYPIDLREILDNHLENPAAI